MRPTWARGECDCPLPLCPTFLHCWQTEVVSTPGTKLCAKLATRAGTTCDSPGKVDYFLHAGWGRGRKGGWVDVSCSRFLVHWIMTFTVVLVVVELRCLRAKFTSFFIIPPPPPPLTMPAQWLDSLTVVAKLCRLIKLLYSLERKLSACLIWSSPDGEREREEGA